MMDRHQWTLHLFIFSALVLFLLPGCSSEYGTVGPSLEGAKSLRGGAVHILAGMSGGPGTADGTGSETRFNAPRGIVAVGDTLFIADQHNHTIRMIYTSTGKVVTLAGFPGLPGVDDGTGTNARFNSPEGITTDGEYLYVADTGNHAIRRVDIYGNVITIAGRRGQSGSRDGSGKDALFRAPGAITTDGEYLYVTDTDNHTIRRVDKTTGDTVTIAGSPGKQGSEDGAGADARFYYPFGIETDGRYLFISDTFNHTIRLMDLSTSVVYTLAGAAGEFGYKDGSLAEARFHYPYGLLRIGSYLYVADMWNSVIRRIDLSSGTVSTVAGIPGTYGSVDGPSGTASFYSPADISFSGDYLYVVDMDAHIVRRVDRDTGEVVTIAGKAPASGTQDGTGRESRFYVPGGVAVDGDKIYVADTFNHAIREVDLLSGEVTTLVGIPGISGTTDSGESPALFDSPVDVIVDENEENIYIVDRDNHVIRRMNLSSGEVSTFAGLAGNPGAVDGTGENARFNSPGRGIRIGDKIYIADTGNHAIRVVDLSSRDVYTLAGELGVAGWMDTEEDNNGVARFNSPEDITTDGKYLYVADTGNHAIRRIDISSGVVVTIAGDRGVSGLVDSENGSPRFSSPQGIVWNDGIIYIADTGNHLLRKLDLSTGEVSSLAGDMNCVEEAQTISGETVINIRCTGQPSGVSSYGDSTDGTGRTTSFHSPAGIVTDGNYLYVMDTGGNKIRRVVMDTGETKTFSFSKNKGISVNGPSGGEIKGNLLYFADTANHIIRTLDVSNLSRAPLVTIAGVVGAPGFRESSGYSALFNRPVGITADGQGNLYVADTANHTIRKIVISTREVTTITGVPGRSGFVNSEFGYPMFNYPRGICIVGDHLYVADSGNHLIRRVNVNTGYVGLVAGLSDYVTGVGSPGTADSTGAAAGFREPRGIACEDTYLYVADTGNHTIRKILRATGEVKTIAGMPGIAGYLDGVGFDARFNSPRGIAVDGNYIYVADTGNNVIRRINKYTGEVLTFAGWPRQASIVEGERTEARFNNIVSLATTPDTPYLFFTDSVENVVGTVDKYN